MDLPPCRQVYLGLGSNLGDRQLNLALAVAQLRQAIVIEAVSPAYETEPQGITDQPRFVNLVVAGCTELGPDELLGRLKDIERRLGRRHEGAVRYGPRPIDIDILLLGDLVSRSPSTGLELPHPHLHERAFVLVPLADLAPELVHPVLRRTVRDLRDEVGTRGVQRIAGGLLSGYGRDVQAERPNHNLALERVGVSGLERVIHLLSGHRVKLFYARLDLSVDLQRERKGAHMSRFPHEVDEALDDLVREAAADIESLAARIAEGVVRAQSAQRSTVRVNAKVPRTRHAPLSAARTQDVFNLLGWGASNGSRTVSLVGVEAAGMTACPCGQEMVRDHARARLLEAGFTEEQAETALAVVPLATHNQRGTGTLVLSDHPSVSADDLVRIVEASMSSEIYELLKRPDEFFVLNRAHANPKFAEDVVRDMLALVVKLYPDIPDDAFVLARQVNHESIHRHDVFAERSGTLGDVRRELAGERAGPPLSLDAWIDRALG